ncbi:MAG: NADH-quinone oxidoreductase subunit M [Candidatus Omnitrophica bacterium]|nr:NADH-quinone oxidoreductase subunit M [Candidatus Omnitrophota bacterium]
MILLLPWIPFLAAFLIMLAPREKEFLHKQIAVTSCAVNFAIVLWLIFHFHPEVPGYQFAHRYPWIPFLGIHYQVGLDGINMTLCLLHALVSFTGAIVSCWPKDRMKEYLCFYLILTGAIYGVFTALDVFQLYLFYELTLIPLYPMIVIWGSKNKAYGAMKLTLFITGGAMLALFGILILYRNLGLQSFDLLEMRKNIEILPMNPGTVHGLAGIFLVGFGVIASLWPLHSWSPIGYAAAPTSVSMLHAGVLKKMGPYLMLRLAVALLPDGVHYWANTLAVLSCVGILYAGYAAVKQQDLKFMIGFSSVSHMGYILLAIAVMNQATLSGAVLLMFSHGVMAATTFACIGFIYEQTHARGVNDFGGLAKKIPFISTCLIMASFASLGLPGFSNFVAELLIFFGSWSQYPIIVSLAIFGVFITSLYLLRMVKSVCYGAENPRWSLLHDARTIADKLPFVILLGALMLFGFWPQGLLRMIQPAVGALLS